MAKDKRIVTRIGQILQTIKFAPQHKDDLVRLEKVFGFSVLTEDAERWYQETQNPNIGDYLEAVENRLRSQNRAEMHAAVADERKEEILENPDIITVSSEVFSVANQTPNHSDIKRLLDTYPESEIISAFKVYVSNLNDYELKFSVKNFFHDGGADGVITSLRKSKESKGAAFADIEESIRAGRLAKSAAELELASKRHDEEEVAARVAANPDALFQS